MNNNNKGQSRQGPGGPLDKVNPFGIFVGLKTSILKAKEPNGSGKK